MSLVNIIEDIENELAIVYMPGAIRHIDDNYDDAWSKAIDRFDLALSKSMETKNHEIAELEGEIYRTTILQLINIYKIHKNGKKGFSVIEILKLQRGTSENKSHEG